MSLAVNVALELPDVQLCRKRHLNGTGISV